MGETLALDTGEDLRKVALHDYRLACISREASLLGRKEVLTGKAKFGIFGDGKEVAQLALARPVGRRRLQERILPRSDPDDGPRAS